MQLTIHLFGPAAAGTVVAGLFLAAGQGTAWRVQTLQRCRSFLIVSGYRPGLELPAGRNNKLRDCLRGPARPVRMSGPDRQI